MAAARTMHARGIPLRHITHQCGRSGFSKRLLASMTKVNVDLSNGMWLLNLSAQMPEFAQPITVRPGPDAPIEGHCMWLTRSLKGKGLFGPGFYPILSAGKVCELLTPISGRSDHQLTPCARRTVSCRHANRGRVDVS